MRLNHINLCSSDVPALTRIFERHFGFKVLQAGKVPEGIQASGAGSDYAMLLSLDGFFIVITQLDRKKHEAFPSNFHVGMMVESSADVHAMHKELREAGLQPRDISSNFEVLGATWTAFYCPVGDGIEIEVNFRTQSAVFG